MVAHDTLPRIPYTPTTRGEVVSGVGWLSLFSVIAAVTELAALPHARPSLGGWVVPLLAIILAAFGFNAIVSTTARLWTTRTLVAAVPCAMWLLIMLTAATGVLEDTAVGVIPWWQLAAVVVGGTAGGVFWLRPRK